MDIGARNGEGGGGRGPILGVGRGGGRKDGGQGGRSGLHIECCILIMDFGARIDEEGGTKGRGGGGAARGALLAGGWGVANAGGAGTTGGQVAG